MKWFKLDSVWWPALLVVMLVGVVLLSTGYDAGLPLYESSDESHHLHEVYILRGLDTDALWLPGYPPGILYVNYAAQLAVELGTGRSAWDQPCLVIHSLRIVDIGVNLLSALLIALIARKLAGDWAGLLAALAWLVAPRVLMQNQFAFPQVYEGLFYLLAAYTALLALEKQQPIYALLSVIAGLGAVIFKYTTFPALALGVGVALWELRVEGRRWLPVLLLQLTLIALTAAALLTFGGVGSLAESGHVETTNFLSGGVGQLLNTDRLAYFFTEAVNQIGLSALVFIVILIVGSIGVWFTGSTWKRLGWLGLVALALSHIFFMVTYVSKGDLDRNMLSSSGLLVVIVSVSLIVAGRWAITRFGPPMVVKIGLALVAIVWLAPQAEAAWRWARYRDLPVTYGAMAGWVNQHLPEERIVVSDRRPFMRDWSCDLRTIPRPTDENLMSRSIDEWLARDVYYAQLTQSQVERMQATPEGRAYLERMTLRQQFPPPGEEDRWRTWRRGHEADIAVYQLWQVEPDFPTDVTFGDQIRLLGYDLDPGDLTPGATLNLRFYWQPVQPPTSDYHVFIHLGPVDDSTTVLAQHDGVPSRSSLRPTSTWRDLDEPFISRDFPLVVPDSLQPGAYRLRIGLYDWRSGQRLLTEEGRDLVEIPVTIEER
jgi:hypothetical protein